MIKNYLKIAFRNLIANKVFSILNILGLALGMTACIYIFQYVSYEFSYDDYQQHKEHLYRVIVEYESGHQRAKISGHFARESDDYFPEIQEIGSLLNITGIFGNQVLSYQDKKFNQQNMYFADAAIPTIFSLNFIKGDSQKSLKKSNFTRIIPKISKY